MGIALTTPTSAPACLAEPRPSCSLASSVLSIGTGQDGLLPPRRQHASGLLDEVDQEHSGGPVDSSQPIRKQQQQPPQQLLLQQANVQGFAVKKAKVASTTSLFVL